jgi:chemotaxis protein histidine kinase CheA
MNDDLLEYYIRETKSRLDELEKLVEPSSRGDVDALTKTVAMSHNIKGTGTSYGYPEITEAAGALNVMAKRALDGVRFDLDKAKQRISECRRALESGPSEPVEW